MKAFVCAIAALGAVMAVDAVAAPTPVETITYETSPCFGFCPTYKVTVSSNGRGIFDGGEHTAVKGKRSFRISPEQFARFQALLRPYKPVGERLLNAQGPCTMMATDQMSVDVRWQSGRRTSHLNYYFGCDMDKHRAMREALAAAQKALPIANFIGKR